MWYKDKYFKLYHKKLEELATQFEKDKKKIFKATFPLKEFRKYYDENSPSPDSISFQNHTHLPEYIYVQILDDKESYDRDEIALYFEPIFNNIEKQFLTLQNNPVTTSFEGNLIKLINSNLNWRNQLLTVIAEYNAMYIFSADIYVDLMREEVKRSPKFIEVLNSDGSTINKINLEYEEIRLKDIWVPGEIQRLENILLELKKEGFISIANNKFHWEKSIILLVTLFDYLSKFILEEAKKSKAIICRAFCNEFNIEMVIKNFQGDKTTIWAQKHASEFSFLQTYL